MTVLNHRDDPDGGAARGVGRGDVGRTLGVGRFLRWMCENCTELMRTLFYFICFLADWLEDKLTSIRQIVRFTPTGCSNASVDVAK